jgi:beta-galactosidase
MQHLGFRIAPHLTRRIFPVDTTHPVVEGLDELDLRDWTGESTLVTAYPNTLDGNYKRNPDASTPWYGWHWSNRGAVSSVPVEKPHRSSWRPILESEFDLAYTPLMELDYGKGRLIWTTLDLEDHVPLDAAARQFAQQIINYGATAPLSPKADKVILIGNEADKAKLDALGLIYQPSNSLVADAGLTIVGEGVDIQDEELQAYLTGGGKIFFLPQHSPEAALGVRLHQVKDFGGSLVVPQWLEVRGISASDLRDRTEHDAWIIQSGGAIASSGLLTRITVGKGVAIFCQIDPDSLNADEKTYFRYTRWRQTRSLAQLLANLGASFKADEIVFKSPQTKRFFLNQSAPPPDLYHPDYRDDFELGDDPYRYYRW